MDVVALDRAVGVKHDNLFALVPWSPFGLGSGKRHRPLAERSPDLCGLDRGIKRRIAFGRGVRDRHAALLREAFPAGIANHMLVTRVGHDTPRRSPMDGLVGCVFNCFQDMCRIFRYGSYRDSISRYLSTAGFEGTAKLLKYFAASFARTRWNTVSDMWEPFLT